MSPDLQEVADTASAEDWTPLYRWREGSGPRKWALDLYKLYHNVPEGDPGRGPYCVNVLFVRARDRKYFQKRLDTLGAKPLDSIKRGEVK